MHCLDPWFCAQALGTRCYGRGFCALDVSLEHLGQVLSKPIPFGCMQLSWFEVFGIVILGLQGFFELVKFVS
jgi:hypothetical protein